jgi:hypothetical protein
VKPTKSDLSQGALDLLILKVVPLGPVDRRTGIFPLYASAVDSGARIHGA